MPTTKEYISALKSARANNCAVTVGIFTISPVKDGARVSWTISGKNWPWSEVSFSTANYAFRWPTSEYGMKREAAELAARAANEEEIALT